MHAETVDNLEESTMPTDPIRIPPDALERTLGGRYGDVHRWRPIDLDPGALVAVHEPPPIGLRGSGVDGLLDAVDLGGVLADEIRNALADPADAPTLEEIARLGREEGRR